MMVQLNLAILLLLIVPSVFSQYNNPNQAQFNQANYPNPTQQSEFGPSEMPEFLYPSSTQQARVEILYISRFIVPTVNITCRVAHATKVQILCGGELDTLKDNSKFVSSSTLSAIQAEQEGAVQVPKSPSSSLGTATAQWFLNAQGQRVLEARRIVQYENQFEFYFGVFECACFAQNENANKAVAKDTCVRSPTIRVKEASLGQVFVQEPMDHTAKLKESTEITCTPPNGQPPPEVFWKMDNITIPLPNEHFMLGSGKNLLIKSVLRHQNGAKFVCCARNVLGTRCSSPAILTIENNDSVEELQDSDPMDSLVPQDDLYITRANNVQSTPIQLKTPPGPTVRGAELGDSSSRGSTSPNSGAGALNFGIYAGMGAAFLMVVLALLLVLLLLQRNMRRLKHMHATGHNTLYCNAEEEEAQKSTCCFTFRRRPNKKPKRSRTIGSDIQIFEATHVGSHHPLLETSGAQMCTPQTARRLLLQSCGTPRSSVHPASGTLSGNIGSGNTSGIVSGAGIGNSNISGGSHELLEMQLGNRVRGTSSQLLGPGSGVGIASVSGNSTGTMGEANTALYGGQWATASTALPSVLNSPLNSQGSAGMQMPTIAQIQTNPALSPNSQSPYSTIHPSATSSMGAMVTGTLDDAQGAQVQLIAQVPNISQLVGPGQSLVLLQSANGAPLPLEAVQLNALQIASPNQGNTKVLTSAAFPNVPVQSMYTLLGSSMNPGGQAQLQTQQSALGIDPQQSVVIVPAANRTGSPNQSLLTGIFMDPARTTNKTSSGIVSIFSLPPPPAHMNTMPASYTSQNPTQGAQGQSLIPMQNMQNLPISQTASFSGNVIHVGSSGGSHLVHPSAAIQQPNSIASLRVYQTQPTKILVQNGRIGQNVITLNTGGEIPRGSHLFKPVSNAPSDIGEETDGASVQRYQPPQPPNAGASARNSRIQHPGARLSGTEHNNNSIYPVAPGQYMQGQTGALMNGQPQTLLIQATNQQMPQPVLTLPKPPKRAPSSSACSSSPVSYECDETDLEGRIRALSSLQEVASSTTCSPTDPASNDTHLLCTGLNNSHSRKLFEAAESINTDNEGGCVNSISLSGDTEANLFQAVASLPQLVQELDSLSLSTIHPRFLARAVVDASGALLSPPGSNVMLTIPPGAVPQGQQIEITVAILLEDHDRPPLHEKQTLLSPVVAVAPANIQRLIQRPLYLKVPHCASQLFTSWLFHVLRSDTLSSPWHRCHTFSTPTYNLANQLQGQGQGQSMVKLSPGSSSNSNSPASSNNGIDSATLEGSMCVITMGPELRTSSSNSSASLARQALRCALVGESSHHVPSPLPTSPAMKLLRLAAFASPTPVSIASEFSIRIYVLDDTHLPMANVRETERARGCVQLDKSRQLHFLDWTGPNQSGSSANSSPSSPNLPLCLSVEDLSAGWECRQSTRCQEIPHRHIWAATQGALHATFDFRHSGSETDEDALRNYFSCRIVVYQNGNFARRQTITIARNFYAIRYDRENGGSGASGRMHEETAIDEVNSDDYQY